MGTPIATHTPGPWRRGTNGGVVSDYPVPEIGGSDAVEFYGGHLIAESVAPRNEPIIAAAPDLLEAARFARSVILANGAIVSELSERIAVEKLDVAIAKAEGRS